MFLTGGVVLVHSCAAHNTILVYSCALVLQVCKIPGFPTLCIVDVL